MTKPKPKSGWEPVAFSEIENFAPLGNYCLKFDDRVPDDFLPVGCDDWTQVMPI